MSIFETKHFTGVLWVLVIALLGVAFLMIESSYFHTKEINNASTRCYEVGGKVILEIHNNFTTEYSFECKR